MREQRQHRRFPIAPRWEELIRGAPLGVLIVCSLLFFLGAGFVLGGFYLAMAGSAAGWLPWVMTGVVGPVTLYLALHLLRLTPWSWLALVVLTVLLTGSTLVRLVGSSGSLVSLLVELALETVSLVYLMRPAIRRTFGWS